MAHKKITGLIAGFVTAGLVLTGCSYTSSTTSESSTQAAAASTVNVDTNNGPVKVPVNPESVVSLDNRTFETLQD